MSSGCLNTFFKNYDIIFSPVARVKPFLNVFIKSINNLAKSSLHTKDNIKRFFLQQYSAEEATRMANWLDENPGALDGYMSEAEWDDFQQTAVLSPDVSGAIWQTIQAQTSNKRKVTYYIKRLAVAASVLLAITLVWYMIQKPAETKGMASGWHKRRTPEQKTKVNGSTNSQTFYLGDGSKIELMPGSSLSYPDTFMTDKRLVTLTGEAIFYVAKNAVMPFVVNSGSISTTALGTIFKVKSRQTSKHIEVSLMEGRVVVKSLRAGSPFKDIYLKPGETVTYNKARETGAIAATSDPHKPTTPLPSTSKISDVRTPSYLFQNEPLAKVFDRFSTMYHLTISYDKTELKDMTFTARLKKEDRPESILQSIALLNDLKIEKTNEGYSVKKN